ncbi:MAG: asparagine synthase (glutamine-hydrolyzing) [Gaiellaceae bacterium]
MCGIAGICSPTAELHGADARLAAMLASMVHRGPDASGAFVDGTVALGSRRLAIIDLKGGDQPIYNEDETVCLVYNGEVYNFPELRERLLASGHRFRTHTDSETIVHLYEERGPQLVEELNGMFAFALWDARRQRLFAARDRLGVKPLYYAWDGTTLAFASEVRALIAGGFVRAELDPDAFVELLTFQNIISFRSLFRGVDVLPPATTIIVDENGLATDRYWDPELRLADPAPDPSEVLERVRTTFDRAVERQLISDVEVASYLSSGLDSSSVTASAARVLRRLTTFTTGFDVTGAVGMEAEFDEREEAGALAATLGTHHHELLLDSHDLDMVLPRVVLHLEEPRMNFSYPNYLTAGFASCWVKVVLSSVGGDELFAGYPWRYELADRPDFLDRYFEAWSRLLTRDELGEGLAKPLAADVDLDRPRRLYDELMEDTQDLPDLERILAYELKTYLHGLLLIEDKLSMAHSLESRVPFLDNELVDLALTIPASMKLADGVSKSLLRRAMQGRLPETVLARGKTGFVPPQGSWFMQGGYVDEILLSERALSRGLFKPEFVRRLIEEHRSTTRNRRLVLWTLLCLEWWHRIFVEGEHAK